MNDQPTASPISAASATPPPQWSAAWRRAWPALLLLLAAILLLYWQTATLMVGVWRHSETFAHAFLVPPMSLWLVWRQRHALALTTPQPCWWMLAPMAVAVLAWLAGDLVSVNSLTQFALVALIVMAVPLVLGWQATKTILFPLGFLFFAVPIGDFLLPVLMEATADFTILALTLSGIPVYREGLQFVIPSGNWSVVEACSGVRYLIASLMVGTLFAYLNYRAMWRRWVFVGVAIVVPIVANWLRAYMIVMLGHLSNNKLAVGVDHLVYGWVFFGIVIMLMFMIGSRWAEPDAPTPTAGAGDAPVNVAGRPWWPAAVAGVLLVATAKAGLWQLERGERSLSAPQIALPDQLAGDWQSVEARKAPMDWAPHFQNPRAKLLRHYAGSRGNVGVHVAYFRAQGYDSKLVNSMHQITPADDTTWNRHHPGELRAGGVAWRLTLLQTAPTLSNSRLLKILVGQTYWVDGRFTTSAFEAKWLGALARLQGRGDDGAVLMLHAIDEDDERARASLLAFANENLATLAGRLKAVQGEP